MSKIALHFRPIMARITHVVAMTELPNAGVSRYDPLHLPQLASDVSGWISSHLVLNEKQELACEVELTEVGSLMSRSQKPFG